MCRKYYKMCKKVYKMTKWQNVLLKKWFWAITLERGLKKKCLWKFRVLPSRLCKEQKNMRTQILWVDQVTSLSYECYSSNNLNCCFRNPQLSSPFWASKNFLSVEGLFMFWWQSRILLHSFGIPEHSFRSIFCSQGGITHKIKPISMQNELFSFDSILFIPVAPTATRERLLAPVYIVSGICPPPSTLLRILPKQKPTMYLFKSHPYRIFLLVNLFEYGYWSSRLPLLGLSSPRRPAGSCWDSWSSCPASQLLLVHGVEVLELGAELGLAAAQAQAAQHLQQQYSCQTWSNYEQ